MNRFVVDVGWTSHRPVRPDEHVSRITVASPDSTEALLYALQAVKCRPQCVMATSANIIDWS